jgi:hypothetical protein
MGLILLVILVFLLLGGGWGYRTYPEQRGPIGLFGIVVIILLVLFLTGHLGGFSLR